VGRRCTAGLAIEDENVDLSEQIVHRTQGA
jgi:hypothetical protein